MLRKSAVSAIVVAACMAAGFVASPALAQSGQASPESFRNIVTKGNQSMVVIKFIMKGDGMGGDREAEVLGTMVDPNGLVLVSNAEMGGMYGGAVVPSDIKVLIGDDTKGVDAKLVASDKEIDLAWVQIDTAPQTPYTHLDLTQTTTEPQVGDFIYTVARSGKYFDRTPIGREFRITGHAVKPRSLMLFPIENSTSLAMPVYNAQGQCVGFTALVLPQDEEMDFDTELFGNTPPVGVLPLKEIARATEQARETASKPAPSEPASTEPAEEAAPKSDETKPANP